ncbi:transposase [Pseudomonas syringae pv. actinidiae]|nr:transposase [Pseudomonas syringae pv. actinidiae]
MEIIQAFKYQLQPSSEQSMLLSRFAGSCRFVFNKALDIQRSNHENGGQFIGYVDMAKRLTAWRNGDETPWLKAAPVHPLQHALKHLDISFKNFFAKRSAFPRFKKRGQHDSFRYPDSKQIKLDQQNGRVLLPKLGWVRYRNSRSVLGEVRNATISYRGGRWYISIQTRRVVENPKHPSSSMVGLDAGIKRFYTLCDGSYAEPLNSFKKHERRLARYQRRMARKQKFSNNWKKAKAKVSRIHADIANARLDYLSKHANTISKNHAVVCIEDLRVSNMSRSAKGSTDQPGKNVRAKSGLNKSILDQGWSIFANQLDYMLGWKGGILVRVPAKNTSRACPACGHVDKLNRPSQSVFQCVACGHAGNADHVAAINIKAAGHAVLACGEKVLSGLSMKQEPTEVVRAVA